MKRDYGKEIDSLKSELQRLSQLIENSTKASVDQDTQKSGRIIREGNSGDDLQKARRARELYKVAQAKGWEGAIESISAYNHNGRGYFTDLPPVSANSLLELDNDLLARVLSTFAHKQRLAILKAILIEPLTASEILEKLGMGTTGQVYHHINSLLSADLIKQENNGKYAFKGHRVHALLLVLAGVQHVLDERYSKGNWNVQEETKE